MGLGGAQVTEERPPQHQRPRLGDLSLRWKLWLAFGGVLTMTGGLIGLAFIVTSLHSAANDSVAQSFEFLLLGNDAVAAAFGAQSNYRAYLLTGEASYLELYTAGVAAYTEQLTQLISRTTDAAQAGRLQTISDNLRLRREEVQIPGIALRQRVIAGAATIDQVIAYMRNEPGQDRLAAIQALAAEVRQAEQARLQARVAMADQASVGLQRLLVAGGFGTILLGLGLIWFIWRDISRPVARLSAVAADIAEGRLDRRIGGHRGDELGRMAASFDLMADRLQRLVHDQDTSLRTVREHEAVVQAVMDSVAVGIIMLDLERRVSIINRPARELLGLDSGPLAAAAALALPHRLERMFADPERAPGTAAGDLLASAVSLTTVVELLTPSPRQLDVSSTPVSSRDGERLGRIFALRDVTREREIDRMKTEFVAMVSHELRTPLTSIKGYVDLLRDGEVGELTADQTEFLTIVATSTDRLVALINDLLDISRIEAGKIELKRERIDLTHAIQAAAASLRPQIEAKRQRLTVTLPPVALAIVGDAGRIAQILTNLLSNAHKYTPPEKDIRIMAAVDGDLVAVSVIDTGIGVSRMEQAQLFTRFYRSSNQAVQEAGGTGLGLTITRSLVELHGGTITVHGNPGQGSTFTFTLPLVTAGADAAAPGARADGQRHVLVVEDAPEIAGLLRRYLERAGHYVSVAATAADGLRAAKRHAPDLITLDVNLPDVDGFALLEWLREDRVTRDIPVLLVTIAPDEGQGQLLGAAGHVMKPVDEAALLERVRQILSPPEPFVVLVADDDRTSRRLLVEALRQAGHQTIEAGDETEFAAAALGAARLDLALINLRRPHGAGVDAVRALRRQAKTHHLPIVLVAAGVETAEPSRGEIESLGATLWQKPLAAGELAAAITDVLSREPS